MPPLERVHDRVPGQAFAPHPDPGLQRVAGPCGIEVRIVGGIGPKPAAGGQQLVEHIPAVSPVVVDVRGGVPGLYRVDSTEGADVIGGGAVSRWVRRSHECAYGQSPLCERGPVLTGFRRGEVRR